MKNCSRTFPAEPRTRRCSKYKEPHAEQEAGESDNSCPAGISRNPLPADSSDSSPEADHGAKWSTGGGGGGACIDVEIEK